MTFPQQASFPINRLDTQRPPWCDRALAQPGESHQVMVDGARIHYLGWNLGARERPAVLLVHGFGAHAHWWDFIAPQLAAHYRVAAMDLSGMGDSGHRERYSEKLFALEIAAVIDHAQLAPAYLVGHSFGGLMSTYCAHAHPEKLRALVVVDSRVSFPDDPPMGPGFLEGRPKRVYPDFAQALARFRLIPEENCAHPAVFRHVAEHSLQRVAGGWQWKFDSNIHSSPDKVSEAVLLQQIGLPMALIYGEHSRILPADIAARTAGYMRGRPAPIMVPGAHHHVLLDRPPELANLLENLLPTL